MLGFLVRDVGGDWCVSCTYTATVLTTVKTYAFLRQHTIFLPGMSKGNLFHTEILTYPIDQYKFLCFSVKFSRFIEISPRFCILTCQAYESHQLAALSGFWSVIRATQQGALRSAITRFEGVFVLVTSVGEFCDSKVVSKTAWPA